MTGDRVAEIRERSANGWISHSDAEVLLAENARLRAQLDAVEELADNAELIPIHVGGGNLVSSQLMVRHSKIRAALNQGGGHV